MLLLIIGIAIFLGVHTLSTLRDKRAGLIARLGENGYKALYSAGSLIGLVLIVYGYGAYRAGGYIPLWDAPFVMKYVAVPLMWVAFIALAAAYAPVGKIKSTLKHPMLVAVKVWALAHLLANGDLGPAPAPFGRGDWIAIGAGSVAWLAIFAFHNALIGVRVLS